MELAWGELRGKERDRGAGRAWMGCEAWKWLGGRSAGRSETGVPDERGWDVKRGNSLGSSGSKERDRSAGRAWMGCDVWNLSSVEIAWGELRRKERGRSGELRWKESEGARPESVGRMVMGCEACK